MKLHAALLLLLTATCIWAQQPVRVATLHSSFKEGNRMNRGDFTPLVNELGWQEDQYENVNIGELIPKLSDYQMVLGCSVFNYDNAQDFAQYAEQWRTYIREGGCLLLTDMNYGQMTNWLPAVDPELSWMPSGKVGQYDGSPATVLAGHPLMEGVSAPKACWSYPIAWSQGLTVIAADGDRRPVVAYREMGKGIVVLCSTYRQYGWPDARLLGNLLAWSKDEARRAAVAQREEQQATARLPEIAVPALQALPTIDGELGEDEWAGAAQTGPFSDWHRAPGLTQQTRAFVAQGPDALYVAFECSDSDLANAIRQVTERDGPVWSDDCVEVFLDATGKREGFHHFTVTAGGAMADELNGSLEGDRYWQAAVSEKPGAWCAELCIPFSALDITAGNVPAATWAGNFCREYQARGGIGQELSCWSPTMGSFHNTRGFGTLAGIQVDPNPYVCNPQIDIKTPERWYVGANQVTARLRTVAGKATEVELACIDAASGREVAERTRVDIPADGAREVSLSIPAATDGRHLRQLVAFDAETPTRSLASSPVMHITTAPILAVELISPPYRNLIQSRDPSKELRVKGAVGDTDARDLRLRASLIEEGKWTPRWQASTPVRPRSDFEFAQSLEDLATGHYTLRLDLIDAEHHLLATRTEKLSVLPPAPFEVTFDSKTACYVNGKPFFPIGLYHVGRRSLEIINARAKELGLPEQTLEQAMQSVKDRGFNMVHCSWAMPDEDYITTAERVGLYCTGDVGSPSEEQLAQFVEMVNRHSSFLFWYGVDEASGEGMARAKAAFERYRRLDPHRPVTAACCNPSLFADNLQAYDLLTMDPYLIRHAPLAGVGDWVDRGRTVGKGRTPIWLVPQAFTIDSHWSEPTNEELCCQAYLGLIHGARALFWYAYYTHEKYSDNKNDRGHWFLPESHLWEYFPVLNAEVQALSEVVLTGDDLGPAGTSTKAIHTNAWDIGGKRYLLAVNATNEAADCELSGLRGETAQVMFEDRQVQVVEGKVKDSFGPYARHVYVY